MQSQYFQAEFAQLQAQGVALENFVYYRSTGAFSDAATHYFVMTTTSDALAAWGALRDPRLREGELCGAANQDAERLESYARQAVRCFVPELASREIVPGQLSLFDFSERKQSNVAAAVVPGASFGSGQSRSMCLVTRVGDALQEPFWPEGLGINRGFMGALDCADLVQKCMPLILTPSAPLLRPNRPLRSCCADARSCTASPNGSRAPIVSSSCGLTWMHDRAATPTHWTRARATWAGPRYTIRSSASASAAQRLPTPPPALPAATRREGARAAAALGWPSIRIRCMCPLGR